MRRSIYILVLFVIAINIYAQIPQFQTEPIRLVKIGESQIFVRSIYSLDLEASAGDTALFLQKPRALSIINVDSVSAQLVPADAALDQRFEYADLEDPKLRQSMEDFFPDMDWSDPGVLDWLRNLQVPISVIDQIMKTGKRGYRSARSIGSSTLVVQGAEDDLVRPRHTQKLVQRLSSANGLPVTSTAPTRYLEISGGHNIIDRNEPSWQRLEQALIEFSRTIEEEEKKPA